MFIDIFVRKPWPLLSLNGSFWTAEHGHEQFYIQADTTSLHSLTINHDQTKTTPESLLQWSSHWKALQPLLLILCFSRLRNHFWSGSTQPRQLHEYQHNPSPNGQLLKRHCHKSSPNRSHLPVSATRTTSPFSTVISCWFTTSGLIVHSLSPPVSIKHPLQCTKQAVGIETDFYRSHCLGATVA